MSLHENIKSFRLLRKLSQEQLAEQLHMSRSNYSKLETNTTGIRVELLHRIADVLRVPATILVSAHGDAASQAGWNDFDFMLELTYNSLSHHLAVVPYDALRPEQLELLASKGYADRESYEDTPLRGRLYTYSPRQVMDRMFNDLNMATLFEYNLIQHDAWLRHWEDYQVRKAVKRAANPTVTPGLTVAPDQGPEIDETAYLVVFIITLTMPDGSVQWLELAQRDIPQRMDEEQALQQLITSRGAVNGDINSFTFDGYTMLMDIVTDIYAN